MNADHGIIPEVLIGILIENLMIGNNNKDGIIDSSGILEIILDWCTRNEIISNKGISQDDFDKAKNEMINKLQKKIPNFSRVETPNILEET